MRRPSVSAVCRLVIWTYPEPFIRNRQLTEIREGIVRHGMRLIKLFFF